MAATIASAGIAPIHGPMSGISSVIPAKMARASESWTPISVSPTPTLMATITPSRSCPRM